MKSSSQRNNNNHEASKDVAIDEQEKPISYEPKVVMSDADLKPKSYRYFEEALEALSHPPEYSVKPIGDTNDVTDQPGFEYLKVDPDFRSPNEERPCPRKSDEAWKEYYEDLLKRTNEDRTAMGFLRNDADNFIRSTHALVKQNQADVNTRLKCRLHDIRFWKYELEREIMDLIQETELLLNPCKKRLETALMTADLIRNIVVDNINCRNRRQGPDFVEDDVERELIREADILRRVDHLIKCLLDDVNLQYKRSMFEKEQLEFDWSDKKEDEQLTFTNVMLHNGSTNKQFYPGVALMHEKMSTPEQWAQAAHDNILRVEGERIASMRLRTLVDMALFTTAKDLRQQADKVDVAFQKRLQNLIAVKFNEELELKKTLKEIVKLEETAEDLKQAIRAKDDFLKVAQTRLHNHKFRPNLEQTADPSHLKLVEEVHAIEACLAELEKALRDNLAAQEHMRKNQLDLEKDISMKKNSIFIDREKCLNHRTRYPTLQRLLGHNHSV